MAHPDPRATQGPAWLLDEIGRYLVGEGAPGADRDGAAREALANGHAAFTEFSESRCHATDVIVTQIELGRSSGHQCRHAFRVAPGPIALFVFCAANCAPGDRVVVRQVTAGAGSVCAEESWPFGLEAAERMTVPAPARLAPCGGPSADHA